MEIKVTRELSLGGKWLYCGEFKGIKLSGRLSADMLFADFETCARLLKASVQSGAQYVPFDVPEFREWAFGGQI